MEALKFDPRHTELLSKQLDEQNELLVEAHRSLSHELQKLQVAEKMLLRKLYEVMSALGLTKKDEST